MKPIKEKVVTMTPSQLVKCFWNIPKCTLSTLSTHHHLHRSPFIGYNGQTFWIHPTTQAIHNNGDWRSPCKTVKADELSRAEIHLHLHQICNRAKMSVTDSLFKLMSWLHDPCCPPRDRKPLNTVTFCLSMWQQWSDESDWIFQRFNPRSLSHPLSAPCSISYFLHTIPLSSPSISHF